MNLLTKQLSDSLLTALESRSVVVEGEDALTLGEIVLEICDKAMEDVTTRHRRESTEYERKQLANSDALNAANNQAAKQDEIIQQQQLIIQKVREDLGAVKRKLVVTYDEGAQWYKQLGITISEIK